MGDPTLIGAMEQRWQDRMAPEAQICWIETEFYRSSKRSFLVGGGLRASRIAASQ
jgi:hypothetical protein